MPPCAPARTARAQAAAHGAPPAHRAHALSSEARAPQVEGRLFEALTRTCLIQSRESCNYSRCARTDKGVSALGQVVALRVRSKLRAGLGVLPPGEAAPADEADARDKQWWLAREEGAPHLGCSEADLTDEIPYLQAAPPPRPRGDGDSESESESETCVRF